MTKRILIVDDDHAMVKTLRDILELHGWETFGSYDGDGVATIVERNGVDVVLMDIRMPHMNGGDALREIKVRRPGTCVILMTAYAAQELLVEAERDGALNILRKPVHLESLLVLLHECTQRSCSLLVVDDDPAYLSTLCVALSERGIPTLQARTLSEALSLLERGSPTAVLLDLKLEHVDPKTSILAVRQVSPSVLLILYSGHDAELSRTLEELPNGLVYAAYMKPLPIEMLVARINSYVCN